jgi:hypothetical protein
MEEGEGEGEKGLVAAMIEGTSLAKRSRGTATITATHGPTPAIT